MPFPFPRTWPQLGEHNRNGTCSILEGDHYFEPANMPDLPHAEEAVGRVVLIAGNAKASGKSVISHQLMHELSGDKRKKIDLMGESEPNLAREDGNALFSRIIEWAEFYELFHDPDAKANILGKHSWAMQNLQFSKELGGRCMVVRLGRPDVTISVKGVAGDIVKYIRSARDLEGTVYLYEYSYDRLDRWQELVRRLHDDMDRVVIVEVPMLSVHDAMRFIDRRIDRFPCELSLDRAGAKRFFNEQAAQSQEMQISIGGLSEIMHDAYKTSEAMRERRVSRQRVAEAYYRYIFKLRPLGEEGEVG
jgi:hypothetical protein